MGEIIYGIFKVQYAFALDVWFSIYQNSSGSIHILYKMLFSVLDQLQCTVGYPVPGATCGGYLNRPCPDTRRHECVRDEFVPHSEGICCSRSGGKGSFLQIS